MVKMRLKNLILLVLSVSLAIGVVLTGGCVQAQIIEDITPQEAFTLIQENQDNPEFVIIDVRTPNEFAEGHIENAINVDFRSETFRDELSKLDKSKIYFIYCRIGGRSGSALNIMKELNFREAYNMLGGINVWKSEGLPTTK